MSPSAGTRGTSLLTTVGNRGRKHRAKRAIVSVFASQRIPVDPPGDLPGKRASYGCVYLGAMGAPPEAAEKTRRR